MSGEMSRVRLYGDIQSALVLMQQDTPGAAGRTKHIDVAISCLRGSCKVTSKPFLRRLKI